MEPWRPAYFRKISLATNAARCYYELRSQAISITIDFPRKRANKQMCAGQQFGDEWLSEGGKTDELAGKRASQF